MGTEIVLVSPKELAIYMELEKRHSIKDILKKLKIDYDEYMRIRSLLFKKLCFRTRPHSRFIPIKQQCTL